MIKRDLLVFSNRPTNGGRLLAEELQSRYLRESTRRRLKRTDGALAINWGSSHNYPEFFRGGRCIVLNRPESIEVASSKVESYRRFQEAGIPTFEFTTDYRRMQQWYSEGVCVLCRRDSMSGGNGITIIGKAEVQAGSDSQLPRSDFYTKYYPKTHEYRVHVWRQGGRVAQQSLPGAEGVGGEGEYQIIDITQKRRESQSVAGEDGEQTRSIRERIVRSLDNGWVHCHEDIHEKDQILDVCGPICVSACAALGLDFGAVDLLVRFSKKDSTRIKDFLIAEVNTAPGLGNRATVQAYRDAILETYEQTKEDRKKMAPVRVRKLVNVRVRTRKGNLVLRPRYRYVYE